MELPLSLKGLRKRPDPFFGEKIDKAVQWDLLSRFIKMKVMSATWAPEFSGALVLTCSETAGKLIGNDRYLSFC